MPWLYRNKILNVPESIEIIVLSANLQSKWKELIECDESIIEINNIRNL